LDESHNHMVRRGRGEGGEKIREKEEALLETSLKD
jgi:hypothetical protein